MTRRRRLGELTLWVALLGATAALAYAALPRPEDSGTLQQRTRAVASTLKCPVCHDLSAADSPAPVAQQMRAEIARELQAGRTPDQIRAEFVASYGEWILLDPPQRGFNLIAWLAPGLLAVAGLLVAAVAIHRWTSPAGGAPSSGKRARKLTAEDERLLRQALAGLRSEIE